MGITLLVAHFNHSLRGSESDADASFVEALANQLGLRFLQRTENVAAIAVREGWNLEDAGRRLRRRFFQEIVDDGAADQIAVAHTADDQAETLLAHLIRGTGVTGLGGIYPLAAPVVRPLLGTRRTALREYLRSLHQVWREDSTNRDIRRLRARVREKLLPVIERDFSPKAVEHLINLARFAREDAGVLDRLRGRSAFETHPTNERHTADCDGRSPCADRYSDCGPRPKPNEGRGPDSPARTVTERLIRRLYEGVRGDRRELSAKHVKEIIHLARVSKSGSTVELPGGIIATREFDELVFTREGMSEGQKDSDETTADDDTYHYVVRLRWAKAPPSRLLNWASGSA